MTIACCGRSISNRIEPKQRTLQRTLADRSGCDGKPFAPSSWRALQIAAADNRMMATARRASEEEITSTIVLLAESIRDATDSTVRGVTGTWRSALLRRRRGRRKCLVPRKSFWKGKIPQATTELFTICTPMQITNRLDGGASTAWTPPRRAIDERACDRLTMARSA